MRCPPAVALALVLVLTTGCTAGEASPAPTTHAPTSTGTAPAPSTVDTAAPPTTGAPSSTSSTTTTAAAVPSTTSTTSSTTTTVAPPRDGAAVYATSCARCHGAAGEGAVGPTLAYPRTPGTYPSLAEELAVVRDGRGEMPAFGAVLDPAALDAVVGWIRSRA